MKVISRKNILKTDFFDVVEEKVRYKNSRQSVHRNVYRRMAVSIFPLGDRKELYLIRQYRYMHGKELIEAPAGLIEKGEKPLSAAKRELKEETGIFAKKWTMLTNVTAAGSIITWEQPIFLARDLSFGKATPEDSEEISLYKIPLLKAVDMVMSGKIRTASSIIGILMIEKLVREGKL